MQTFDKAWNRLEEALDGFLDEERMLAIPGIREIRRMYIPEMVFALHNLYIDGGKSLHRRWYTKALDLSCTVADPEKSFLEPFMESGRLEEYVQELARVSSLVLGAATETNKAMPELEIWNVQKTMKRVAV